MQALLDTDLEKFLRVISVEPWMRILDRDSTCIQILDTPLPHVIL